MKCKECLNYIPIDGDLMMRPIPKRCRNYNPITMNINEYTNNIYKMYDGLCANESFFNKNYIDEAWQPPIPFRSERCTLILITKEAKKMNELEALRLTKDFYMWAEENPGKTKEDWPRYREIEELQNNCPLCSYYRSNIETKCAGCILSRQDFYCFDERSMFQKWMNYEKQTETHRFDNPLAARTIWKICDARIQEITRKPKFTYANEVEVGLAVIKDWRKIGDKIKPESFARNCAACIYNIEKSHPYRTLTCKKTNGVTCLFRNICENRDGKTGNQIADECQGLLNTLVLCPGHNCGFVTRERETNRTCGGNYRCEKCNTIYDSSLWTAHWKPIEPAKKFEPFDFVVHVPDKGRLFQLMARLTFADKTIAHVNDAVSGRKLERKHVYYDEGNKCYGRLYDKAKEMGLIK